MLFFLAVLIITIACSVVTIKTLVGYSDISLTSKFFVALLVSLGWFSPLFIGLIGRSYEFSSPLYVVISYAGYTLLGFLAILLTLLLLRDFVWYVIYGFSKIIGADAWSFNPMNISKLNKANLIVIACAFLISGYAFYQGMKMPQVIELNLTSPLIKKDLRIVQISDLHITRATPASRIQKIVYQVNALAPDIIVMTGDIIDDLLPKIDKKLDILGGFNAPYGVYSVMGNHEFYSGINSWSYKFRELGFHTLYNRGVILKPFNIFLSGIPDAGTSMSHPIFRIDFEQALKGSSRENYRILLSHNPVLVDNLTSFNYNMMLSGHTHGGQLFPFQLLVKKVNGYLGGHYLVNNIDFYLSRGAGTWGPTMRLFAPSEITLINLRAQP